MKVICDCMDQCNFSLTFFLTKYQGHEYFSHRWYRILSWELFFSEWTFHGIWGTRRRHAKNLGYKLTMDGYDMSEQVQNVKNIWAPCLFCFKSMQWLGGVDCFRVLSPFLIFAAASSSGSSLCLSLFTSIFF